MAVWLALPKSIILAVSWTNSSVSPSSSGFRQLIVLMMANCTDRNGSVNMFARTTGAKDRAASARQRGDRRM